jgi:D-methionine transport system ATP-binding protein
MIELIDLHKTYTLPNKIQVTALRNINLSVKQGAVFGVVGESGAGKSTLIRCINLLEVPTSGQVIVENKDLTQLNKKDLRRSRRKIGMIFQHFNLLNTRTAYQNIAFPLELEGVSNREIAARVHPLLELTGLTTRKDYYPSQLSGGQKQRVAIARALANQPSVLLSDEATSALDPENRHAILQLLKKINQELGLTIVLITHELQVIKEICHHVALLEHGQIVDAAEVFEFFSQSKTAAAKKLINTGTEHNLFETLHYRLTTIETENSIPLWRLSFYGKAAQEPLIAELANTFGLNLSILQAQIELIRDQTIGTMIVQVGGEKEKIVTGMQHLISKNVFVEVIGYVRPDA